MFILLLAEVVASHQRAGIPSDLELRLLDVDLEVSDLNDIDLGSHKSGIDLPPKMWTHS
jgi:hypothetical protein